MTREVSVVIPTRGRRDRVADLVEGLQHQILDGGEPEIIVVLDGDVDGTEQKLAALRVANRPVVVRLSDTGDDQDTGHGAAAARNAGVGRATGTIVVFIDDDIEPVGNRFLATHVERHSQDPARLVVGNIQNRIDRPSFLYDLSSSWWIDTQAKSAEQLGFTGVTTANLSIPVSLFRELGCFDERLHRREDRDLGARAEANGTPIVAEPDAIGIHHFSTDVTTYFDDVRREAGADVTMARSSPWVVTDLPLDAYRRIGRVRSALLRLLASNRFGGERRRLFVFALGRLERFGLRGAWRRMLRVATTLEYWSAVIERSGVRR